MMRRLDSLTFLSTLATILTAHPVSSREQDHTPPSSVYPLEERGDAYVPVPREERRTSPAYRSFSSNFLAVQVNVDEFGQNVLGDAANEPSIAVDPTDPDRMVIGWRQFDTVASNFRQAGYGYTTDGGLTWTFPGVIEPGVFRSDPVLDSDSAGRLYYNSLTVVGPDYVCDVFQSDDGGATWDTGTPAHGGDKQWMAIDRSGGIGDGHIYAYWTSFFSSCSPGFFTRSTNGGLSYENCITVPGNPFWGTIAVGPDGELYVCGASATAGDFVVIKSSNARDASQSLAWDFSKAVSLDGQIDGNAGFGSPNPDGLLGQAWIAVDHSGTASRGNVYLLCSVNRDSSPDPLDVMFARSTDGGVTWSSPVRINDDPGTNAFQWFGTMSVSPSGRIDAVWLDTRDNLGGGGLHSSLYYSYSTDAGVTWSANERLSDSFNSHLGWPNQNKMGDYFDMVSDEAGFRLAWAATFNGEQDVYFGRLIQPTGIEESEAAPESVALLTGYPNPFDTSTTVRYRVPRGAFVTLGVYDAGGREVATLVERQHPAGSYEVSFDGRGLASGVYFYRMRAGEFRDTKKVLLAR
jgi:hypothetical protein